MRSTIPLPHRPAAQRRGLPGRSRGPLVLSVAVAARQPAGDPHRARQLSFDFEGPDGAFPTLGSLDGHYLSTEVPDGFTGRVNGIYAAEGTAHFDWFD